MENNNTNNNLNNKIEESKNDNINFKNQSSLEDDYNGDSSKNVEIKKFSTYDRLKINSVKKKNLFFSELWDWTLHFLAAFIVAVILVRFVAQITVVVGDSMYPTLQNGDKLLIEKISIKVGELKRGDIVVVDASKELLNAGRSEKNSPIIKRIIAIEGDKVEVKNGKVYVNNSSIDETYINGNFTDEGDYNTVFVPDNRIYIMGDNRFTDMSVDSRILGTFDESNVVGKVVLRVFPVMKFGILK